MKGTFDWKKGKAKLIERIKTDKKLLLIVLIGIAGMLLLLFSELFSGQDTKKEKEETPETTNVSNVSTDYHYAEDIEKRLTGIISSIQGAGKTQVMVTLENSAENIYASQGKESQEKESSAGKEKYSKEEEYVIIKSDGSDENGMLVKIVQPKIRGVAVVCEGGDSVYVKQRIMEAVTAVLDISSARISIAKMANQ